MRHQHSRRGVRLLLGVFLAAGSASLATGEPVASTDKPLKAKLTDLEGNRVALQDLRGGPVLIELWASWCLPCREQAEVITGLQDLLEEKQIAVYAVNVGEEREKVEEHLERQRFSYPVLLDRLQVIPTRLRLEELPALVLLDADGRVTATATGLTQRGRVLQMLERLEGGDVGDDSPAG